MWGAWPLLGVATGRMAASSIGTLLPGLAQRACERAGLDQGAFSAAALDLDVTHYERFAGRRFASKNAALFHYLKVGTLRGWEPCAGFSPAYYRRSNPDIVAAGYEPFAHYCRFGRHEGRGGTEEADKPDDSLLRTPGLRQILERPRPRKDEAKVDVVIPVYGNRHLALRTIDSVLAAKETVPFELIVVDDASPDATLATELRQLAGQGSISLLVNDTNVGFVRSANRGLLLHEDRDVVLLNSDTQVFDGWLGRLLAVLHGRPAVATATPLSNAATIMSYPVTLRENTRSGVDFAALDDICFRLNPGPVELPTGIGFCMAIKRKCLDEVGVFDAERFGLGYGEENDFCRRAAASGWSNVAATNVFVWHRGGGSFGTERGKLIEAAQATLERLHPGYRAMVWKFITSDPLNSVRAKLDAARVAADPRTKTLDLRGGAFCDSLNDGMLAVRLEPEIAPFCGAYRPMVPQFQGVPNLPRITHRTSVTALAEFLNELSIRKMLLPGRADGGFALEGKFRRAAQEAGVAVEI